jgi:hydroxyquinol 1,2-dioxygenase
MEDLTEATLTDATLRQMADTPDQRLREIMEAAVRHLHAFAREVSLTPEEWLFGIKFLTQVGHACTPSRQEFILLSDTLGLSRMVSILHEGRIDTKGTETSLLGPFYRESTPLLPLGSVIATDSKEGQLVIFGKVTDEEGIPIAHALLEVWQTDSNGAYDLQAQDPSVMNNRASFRTNLQGRYHFRTNFPRGYKIPLDGPVGGMIDAQKRHGHRPAHTHFLIGADGFRELVTALYYSDDPYIDSDTVFGVANSLIVTAVTQNSKSPMPNLPSIEYDFVLSRAKAGEATSRVGADPTSIIASTA